MPTGLGRGGLGTMPLGGGTPYLQTLIEQPSAMIFRAAGVQFRSAATGKYTGEWVDITPFVKRWGTIEQAIDDVRFNRFTDRGCSLVVNNDTGEFNHHSNASSLWYGYLTRYRTKLRVQAAYYDTDLSQTVPSTPTLGIFILDQEIGIQSGNNDVYLRGSSIKSVFDDAQATDIGGVFNTTLTADAIIGRIRDQSDGAGNFVFREFITSTAWSITTATNPYYLTTDLALNLSVWDLMDKLAETEGYVVLINRTGGLEFRPRGARQAASQLSFYGQNFPRPNIIRITDQKEAWDKHYNLYRLKYLTAETSTSYVSAGTVTAVNSSNPSWLFGAKAYEFDNFFAANTSTAQTIVNNLYSMASSIPVDVEYEATFVPGLEVMDRIDLSYRSYDLANNALWDVMIWDTDKWGEEGANFDLNSTSCYLTGVRSDLDSMKTSFTARVI